MMAACIQAGVAVGGGAHFLQLRCVQMCRNIFTLKSPDGVELVGVCALAAGFRFKSLMC